jgi:uncharacterized protein
VSKLTCVTERQPEISVDLLDEGTGSAGIRRLSLFGSVARGDAEDDSDVDLAAELDPEACSGLFALGALEMRLAELICCPVDLPSELVEKARLRVNIDRNRRRTFSSRHNPADIIENAERIENYLANTDRTAFVDAIEPSIVPNDEWQLSLLRSLTLRLLQPGEHIGLEDRRRLEPHRGASFHGNLLSRPRVQGRALRRLTDGERSETGQCETTVCDDLRLDGLDDLAGQVSGGNAGDLDGALDNVSDELL